LSNPCALPSLALPPDEQDLKGLPKLEERIRRRVGTCVAEFGLVADGDRILVGLSGGKDSWALLDVLESLRRRAPIRFEVHGATIDPGFQRFNPDRIAEVCEARGIPHVVLPAPIDTLVRRRPEVTPCAMCSRLRRGRLSTMPLKLVSDDGANTVIRPLATCEEEDLRRLAWLKGYPIVPCGCPLCGASVLESRRAQVKALVAQLKETIPDLKFSMLKAMKNVKTSHLLDLRLPPVT
jgi:tRNA 2-thiocytidine biosynthesis protein TtcA